MAGNLNSGLSYLITTVNNNLFRQSIDDVSFLILSMREPRSGLHRIKSEEVHFQDDSPEDYQVNETETQVQNDKDYGNTGCGFFKEGVQNLKDFWLKINCSQMKLLNFEDWASFRKIK